MNNAKDITLHTLCRIRVKFTFLKLMDGVSALITTFEYDVRFGSQHISTISLDGLFLE
jgi:hypothetical protein